MSVSGRVYFQLDDGRYMDNYYSQPLGTSERVKWFDVGRDGDSYTFKSAAHSRYLCAANEGNITANREKQGKWEKFKLESQGGGKYKVKCDRDKKYIYFANPTFRHNKGGGGTVFKISNYVDFGPLGTEKVFFEIPDGRFMDDAYSHTLKTSPDGKPRWFYALFKYNNTYAFQSVSHNRYLCAANEGNITCNRIERDSWELFIVENKGGDHYTVKCNRDSKYIYLDASKFRHNKDSSSESGINFRISNKPRTDDDEKKEEKVEIVSIKFDLNSGQVTGKTPAGLAEYPFENNTDTQKQSGSATISYETTAESNFGNTAGGSIAVGTKFETGIPFVAKGHVQTTLTASYEHSWGKKNTFTKKMEYKVESNPIAPHTKFTAKIVAWESTMSVPYTMVIKKGGKTEQIRGTWTGVSTWNVRLVFDKD